MQLKLTTMQIIHCFQGLSALDGYDKIIKDGEREKPVRENYKFGGGFRLLVAKNLSKLRPVVLAYEQVQTRILAEGGANEESYIDNPEKRLEVQNALVEAKELEQEIVLVKFKSDQLKLDENPIPVSTLMNLFPLLEDE